MFFTLGISSFYVNHKNPSIEEIRSELNNSKRTLSSIQSDLSSYKKSTADQQAYILSFIQSTYTTIVDTIKTNKTLEYNVIKIYNELAALKNEMKNSSNKANAADAQSRAAD